MANRGNYPSLMEAVIHNDYEAAALLIAQGGDVNQRDDTMLTPYLCAGSNGFADIVALAIKNGADTKSTNRFGGTALLPSAEKGYLRTVQICLQNGVPVNHANDLGWTALHEAILLGNGGLLYQDIIRTLMENGADPEIRDRQGRDAFQMAREKNQCQVLPLLTKKSSKDVPAAITDLRRLLWDGENRKAYDLACAGSKETLHEPLYSYYKGYTLFLLGRYGEAIDSYGKLQATAASNDGEYYFYIAQCYRLMHDTAAALAAFDKGAAAGGHWEFFLYHKSNYLRELQMHEAAVAVMDRLLSVNKNRYDYWFHKANSLRALNRHGAAAEAMDYAIMADPDNMLYHNHKRQSLELSKGYD